MGAEPQRLGPSFVALPGHKRVTRSEMEKPEAVHGPASIWDAHTTGRVSLLHYATPTPLKILFSFICRFTERGEIGEFTMSELIIHEFTLQMVLIFMMHVKKVCNVSD